MEQVLRKGTDLVRKQAIKTIDSREVAEMLGKDHSELLKEIEGRKDGKNVGLIPVLTRGNFHLVNYFIEDCYKDKKGQRRKCYQITKMGCELIGNKQQGEKGILFTAKYVERFNEMEKSLSEPKSSLDLLELQVKALKEVEQKVENVDKKFNELPLFTADAKALKKLVNRIVVPLLGGKKSNAYKPLSKKVFSDLYGQVHREFGVSCCDEIKRKDLEFAKELISDYRLPKALKNEIESLNNQISFDEGDN